ncbi:GNAT family N-acetyltransferase [Streptomyces sp. NPDC001941]|uniref:GNAT family N-acetyltransferase n=1 Tax=Streptomyces sp. NPDC001941 TaxID=3154659 RepID=UPI0033180825
MDSDTEVVRDVRGTPVAFYEAGKREDVRWADDLRPAGGVSAADAAELVLAELSGWGATTREALEADLAARGARIERRFASYTHVLRDSPHLSGALRLPAHLEAVPATGVDPAVLREAYAAAYPVGHPDHDMSAFEDLEALLQGTLMEPLLPVSTVLLDTRSHRGVAAVLVHDTPGDPPLEGPWISEVFRDPSPAYRGTGSLLLRHVLRLSAEAGLPALGLSVTVGNPAARLYEATGFVRTEQWADLRLP